MDHGTVPPPQHRATVDEIAERTGVPGPDAAAGHRRPCPCRILHSWLVTSRDADPRRYLQWSRVMCLRFVFLLVTWLVAWLWLCGARNRGRTRSSAASPARGSSAAAQGAAEAFLGGPGADRGAARCDPAHPASQAGDDGDPGYGAALASRHCSPTLAAKSRRKRPAPGNPPQYLRPGTSPWRTRIRVGAAAGTR